jgi:hypothetical protein
MKISFKISMVLLLLAIGTTNAQVDRRIGQSSQKAKPEAEKKDYIEESVTKLTEELTLDSFQQAVIRNIFKDSEKEFINVTEMDIPNESKIEKLGILKLKLVNQIKAMLNPDQLAKYEASEKKKKKKKK